MMFICKEYIGDKSCDRCPMSKPHYFIKGICNAVRVCSITGLNVTCREVNEVKEKNNSITKWLKGWCREL